MKNNTTKIYSLSSTANSTSPVISVMITGTSSAHAGSFDVSFSPQRGNTSDAVSVETAVYGHIRAIRALGRTSINSAEIARSLGLPLTEVAKAVAKLHGKRLIKLSESWDGLQAEIIALAVSSLRERRPEAFDGQQVDPSPPLRRKGVRNPKAPL